MQPDFLLAASTRSSKRETRLLRGIPSLMPTKVQNGDKVHLIWAVQSYDDNIAKLVRSYFGGIISPARAWVLEEA